MGIGEPCTCHIAIYAVAIHPLIHHLEDKGTKQLSLVCRRCCSRRRAQSSQNVVGSDRRLGSDYGYLATASKTCLIVKESYVPGGSKYYIPRNRPRVAIPRPTDGRRHLGAALGTPVLVESYVQLKVTGWVRLSPITTTQPQAAYWYMQPLHTVLLANGPTWPGQLRTSKTGLHGPVQTGGGCHP